MENAFRKKINVKKRFFAFAQHFRYLYFLVSCPFEITKTTLFKIERQEHANCMTWKNLWFWLLEKKYFFVRKKCLKVYLVKQCTLSFTNSISERKMMLFQVFLKSWFQVMFWIFPKETKSWKNKKRSMPAMFWFTKKKSDVKNDAFHGRQVWVTNYLCRHFFWKISAETLFLIF